MLTASTARRPNKSAVDVFLRAFRESISFAQINSSDINTIRPLAEAETDGKRTDQSSVTTASQPLNTVKTSDLTVIRELPIPLEAGLTARIPYPLSEDDYKILIETLELWKRRIVRQFQPAPPSVNEATLISRPIADHVIPPLAGQEKEKLDELYSRFGVNDKGPDEKNQVLMKEIQARKFFAFGGGETKEMELRANERIYLLKHHGGMPPLDNECLTVDSPGQK